MAAVPIIAAISSGIFSDAIGKRRLPMAGFAPFAALALFVLAGEPAWAIFVIPYGLFYLGLTGFLAVDTALARNCFLEIHAVGCFSG